MFAYRTRRRLTDQPKDEKTDNGTKVKVEIKQESLADDDACDGIRGNIALLPVFRTTIARESDNQTETKPSVITDTKGAESNGTKSVLHNGCFIDIDKLLDQLARSEKTRERTEELLVDLRKSNTELKATNAKAKDKIKDLEKEVKNCGRLLNDAEQSLSVTNVSLLHRLGSCTNLEHFIQLYIIW